MDDFVNVIKYTKINGRDILEVDETFFINVMGMEVDLIKKLRYELKNVKNLLRMLNYGDGMEIE